MKTSECYLPEGSYTALPEVRQALSSPDGCAVRRTKA